ncbi:MAG: DoxX-like family protein [Pseudomonadota bacterium]|nr:DoxX-like family protein [Pseudomonadota bacterium]
MTSTEMRVLRGVLATIWLVTAVLSFGLYPIEGSLALVADLRLSRQWSLLVVYSGAALDLVMGVLTLALPLRALWLFQGAVIVTYSLLATLLVPEYWLHPFGPLLKNLAILALLWLLYRHGGTKNVA